MRHTFLCTFSLDREQVADVCRLLRLEANRREAEYGESASFSQVATELAAQYLVADERAEAERAWEDR